MSARAAGPLTIGKIVQWSKASCALPSAALGRPVCGLSNDSRSIRPGEVFTAIATDKDDGHRWVADALERGAAAAIVAKKKLHMFTDAQKEKLIVVNDPLRALGRIASGRRAELAIPIIGVTGSSGKTTARNFIGAVLRRGMDVGETHGNWNNHIGVSLSLLRFSGKERAGVLEMGANHAREIHDLSMIVRPDIGLITNIGYAHIGYFGSLENIARAKFEILDGMSGPSAMLLLNGDDVRLVRKAASLRQKVLFFGFSRKCHVRAVGEVLTDDGRMRFEVDGRRYALSMPGRHFIYSALAAICLGRRFGIDEKDIAEALGSLRPPAMRGTIERKADARFIVDCYNANPSSMKSAIRLLCDVAGSGRKTAIVGDMLELGKFSRRLHRDLGRQLAAAGVDRVLAIGEFAGIVADAAIQAGMKAGRAAAAPDSARGLVLAKKIVRPGDVVLLKGSRLVHLETIYEGFGQSERKAS